MTQTGVFQLRASLILIMVGATQALLTASSAILPTYARE
jgi:hypothetical protein